MLLLSDPQRAEAERLAVEAASSLIEKLRDGDLLSEDDVLPPCDPPETVTIKTSMNPLVPAALLETLVQQTATDGKVSLLEIVRSMPHCCVTNAR